MPCLFDLLFTHTWWIWNSSDGQWLSAIYHWFNLAEGIAWVVLGLLVLRRYIRHRHSALEVVYGLAFFAFAATDFREAWEQSSWLIWLKLVNLIVLLVVRRTVIRRWYPIAKVW